VVNLTSNALKFTDEGGKVEISAKVIETCEVSEPERAESPLCDVSSKSNKVVKHLTKIIIKDNGKGISKEG